MWYLGPSDRGLMLRVAALVLVAVLIVALLIGSFALVANEISGYGITI